MGDDEYLRAMEAQRLSFEQQFGSLEEMGFEDKTKTKRNTTAQKVEETEEEESDTQSLEDEDSGEEEEEGDFIYGKKIDDESSDEDDVFRGFDDNDDEKHEPEVIKFVDTSKSYEPASKDEIKLLKSGKAYKKQNPIVTKQNRKGAVSKETEEDIKNDLELQRFLQESHILSNFDAESSGADLTLKTIDNKNGSVGSGSDGLFGKARRYTINSRLKSISSVNGHESKVQKLENISMAMRKGMVKSYKNKISKYEQDAKDGGIVLSKVKKGEFRKVKGNLTLAERIGDGIKADQKKSFRQKGLKVNSVGRNTRNGLVIAQKDIDRISNSGRSQKGKKRR